MYNNSHPVIDKYNLQTRTTNKDYCLIQIKESLLT